MSYFDASWRSRWLGGFAAASLALAACGGSEADVASTGSQGAEGAEAAESADGDQVGEAASESLLTGEFETLDGGTIDLASLQGQDVVLWFWAPW